MKALLKALFFKGLVQFGISTGLKSKAPKYIMLKILAGCLFLVGGIFFLISIHQFLLVHYERPVVNLFFAIGFIAIGVIILIAVAIRRAQHKNKNPFDAPLRTLEKFGERAQVQVKELGTKAETAIRRKPSKALLGVAIVSLILGWRSGRKKS